MKIKDFKALDQMKLMSGLDVVGLRLKEAVVFDSDPVCTTYNYYYEKPMGVGYGFTYWRLVVIEDKKTKELQLLQDFVEVTRKKVISCIYEEKQND